MFGTYNRLNLHVSASDVEVIRAARTKLKRGAFLRDRNGCKQFYRLMLDHHKQSRNLFNYVQSGNLNHD